MLVRAAPVFVRAAPALVRAAPALVGAAAGVLALGPALGAGFVLRYDMVFVPDPPVVWSSGGFPRAVPSDLVVALLSHVLPATLVQKLILIGIFILAATGAAALIPDDRPRPEEEPPPKDGPRSKDGPAPKDGSHWEGAPPSSGRGVSGRLLVSRLAAAVFYAWNAYLAQRLLLGQWALLLGFAGLPWAVRAAVRGGPWRLALALIPAAIGGFQAMLVSALVVLPIAATCPPSLGTDGPAPANVHRHGRRRKAPNSPPHSPPLRRPMNNDPMGAGGGRVWGAWRWGRGVLGVGVVVGGLSAVWVVPAVVSGAVTDPAGVDAFAARADGPFGTLGSLLSLGGIWNVEANVPGQGGWLLASARLLVAAVAVFTFVRLPWTLRNTAARWGVGYWRGLVVAACMGVGVAVAGAYAPGVVKGMIAFWPGFGPLRDGQLYIAPLALVQAVGFGVAVGRFARPDSAGDPDPNLASGPGTGSGRALGSGLEGGRGPGTGSGRVLGLGGGRRPGPGAGVGSRVGVWGWVAVGVPAVVGVLVPVLVLPAFAWGAGGRLAAVRYPDEWRRVQEIVNGDPRPGALLSLPWSAHRAFDWNGGRVILDPATKLFARRVVWNDSLAVGLGGGRLLQVGGEDPLARSLGPAILAAGPPAIPARGAGPIEEGAGGVVAVSSARGAGPVGEGGVVVASSVRDDRPIGEGGGALGAFGVGGEGPLVGVLRGVGIRYVVVSGRNENRLLSRLVGAVPVYVGRQVLLLRL
ncbi:hypothetical protein [Sphaerisporangium corydalis]|uniref:hypothetical protein n=1 Tax=Sphaerisporangium corydalis TaxID=1441875 RepID=UPI0036D250F8